MRFMARPTGNTLSPDAVLNLIEKKLGTTVSFNTLSMSEVAKCVGIKTPSLYSHFMGLQDLKDQVTLRGLTRLIECLQQELQRNKDKQKFRNFMQAYRIFGVQNPLLFEATQFGIRPEHDLIKQKAEEVVILAIKALDPWKIPSNKVIHSVRILRSLLNGFISLELQKGFRRKEDTEESFKELIHFAEKGLEAYR